MTKKAIITVPRLATPGGVSAFWNALLPRFSEYEGLVLQTLEIGGHGKNVLGPLIDQWRFRKRTASAIDLVVLNPSLGSRSFFRDGLFARHLVKKQIPFAIFFHGWDLAFEEKVSQKYISFFQSSLGKANRIFVLSQDFANTLREWGYSGEIRVETTTVDSVLIEGFSLEKKWKHINNDPQIKILFLSRLLKEKGIYEVVDAFQNLERRFSNLELIIAGDGEDFQDVATYVKDRPTIEMKGHVNGERKAALFEECHIYCMPSYSEGLPTSVLEAMAFGLPVVTTAVGGLKDFFENEKMGYLVNLDTKDDLEHKLADLVADADLRKRMGTYNHTFAQERLISKVVAKRLHRHFLESMTTT